MRKWSDKTEITATNMVNWIGITHSKFYDWQFRYGKVNEHNAWIPRDFWLTDYEKQAIINYYLDHPLEGYRRLTYMTMHKELSLILWSITTISVCTVPLVILRQRINLQARLN